MLEARLEQASLLKKLLDAVKELVTDANFECNEEGIQLQAMDNSHVALVAVKLEASGFKKFRCDRPMPLGVNLNSLSKVLKCAKDDDQVTLKAGDNNDVLNLLYESPSMERISEYEMKLMDIDADQLGIPETEYEANVTMSSSEFARIVRDLSNLGESVKIEVTKEGVRFTSEGDAANGSVLLKHSEDAADKLKANEEDDSRAGSSKSKGKKKANGVKKEKKPKVKKEKGENGGDDDEEMEEADAEDNDEEEGEEEKEDEEEEEAEPEEDENDDDGDGSSKKRKRKANGAGGSSKRSKKDKEKNQEEEAVDGVVIAMSQPVSLTFSLKYLINFTKSTALSRNVHLAMTNDVPLLVSYPFGPGKISYYLAPKIGDE